MSSKSPSDRSATSTGSSSSPYPRGNYWGADGDEADHGTDGVSPHSWDPNDKLEHLAHDLLRQTGRLACGATLYGEPGVAAEPHLAAEGLESPADDLATHYCNREVELSEPEYRPPTDTVRDQRHRRRVNRSTGYISGGETTGVVVLDRPAGELLELVEILLGHVDPPRSVYRDVRETASELKHNPDGPHDPEIMRRVLAILEPHTNE